MNLLVRWLNNARKIALAQSLLPAILAVLMALGRDGFCWWQALLAVVGVAAAHLSLNLADDYFDYKVDMLSDRERVQRSGFRAMMVKYPYLTDGSETPESLFRAILCFAAAALSCGLPVFILRTLHNGFGGADGSWWLIAIVAATAVLGVFYSAPPFKLGYRGLGELVIGIIFGPLLMMGTYYAACGHIDMSVIWISIPVGLLVLNIVYTHSFIERVGDEASNKMTFARLLRTDKANLTASFIFNFLPFAMILIATCVKHIHPLYQLVWLVLPRAVWLYMSLVEFTRGKTGVPEKPPLFLGPMREWNSVREAGIDWFLMRWLAARNTLSGFCLMIIIAKIIELLIK